MRLLAIISLVCLGACGDYPQTSIPYDDGSFHEDPSLKADCELEGGIYASFSGPTCSVRGTFCMKKIENGFYLNDEFYPIGSCVADMIDPIFKDKQ